MKNLKVYNTQEKMKGKSYKITKKVLAVALAATSILSFAGCSSNNKKDFILQDTLLENAVVATVSTDKGYEPRILRVVQHKNYDEDTNKFTSGIHTDYFDIINGERLTDMLDACCQVHKNETQTLTFPVRYVEEIVVEGSVFSFLTEEELKLLNEGKEDEVDFVKVLVRIREQEEAKRKVKQ